ncbi:hypothetical protein MSG28_015563 [Choristoneura fumiferana]|uniref:Uncharacterized protein n=1 Tax=Choristoneura fumiferana TaxID=7141 RepID=A0ACC0KBF2_CHOFU|nr:hypothetical protein MSG28_015563 [Choristoneura fumiferana]
MLADPLSNPSWYRTKDFTAIVTKISKTEKSIFPKFLPRIIFGTKSLWIQDFGLSFGESCRWFGIVKRLARLKKISYSGFEKKMPSPSTVKGCNNSNKFVPICGLPKQHQCAPSGEHESAGTHAQI